MENINILKKLKKAGGDYIKSTVKSKNKVDLDKLKSLFSSCELDLRNFDKEKIDLKEFSWNGFERDRNWWWQLQALPFLNWYVNCYDLLTKEERVFFYKSCVESVRNWIEKTSKYDSPLAWHDHATAFRVRNVVNWLVFCSLNAADIQQADEVSEVSSLIYGHLAWLCKNENFSKHTNHGFDQAMISLTISLMFEDDALEDCREISKARLKDELEYAFSVEGVHKENSPGYQKFMLERLRQLTVFAILGELEFSEIIDKYLANATQFLQVITLPNGRLPLIGDTKYEEGVSCVAQKGGITLEAVNVYDYSVSGYVIIRGKDGRKKDFYILLKNCHDSNYHRHDDDMMLFFFYDGKVVFGDGGLYNHQENDVRRKNIRSYLAHSVPYIDSKAIRNKDQLSKKPEIIRTDDLEFVMRSSMFGVRMSRTVALDIEAALQITIKDEVINEEGYEAKKIFLVDEFDGFQVENNTIEIDFPDFKCCIENKNDKEPVIYKHGWDEKDLESGAYISKEYGKLVPALRISMSGCETSIKIVGKNN